MKRKVEYVWLDGYTPEPNLRSKVRILDLNTEIASDIPTWGFDGSSTKQAEGNFSDCYLKPVKVYRSNNLNDTLYAVERTSLAKGHPMWKRTIDAKAIIKAVQLAPSGNFNDLVGDQFNFFKQEIYFHATIVDKKTTTIIMLEKVIIRNELAREKYKVNLSETPFDCNCERKSLDEYFVVMP